MKTHMSEYDATGLIWLAEQWSCLCYLCGTPFNNVASITREHLVAKHHDGSNNLDNIAPAHFNCNSLKSCNSILATVKLIEAFKVSKHFHFKDWVNKKVPNRIVPDYAFLPVKTAKGVMIAQGIYHEVDAKKILLDSLKRKYYRSHYTKPDGFDRCRND